MSWIASLFKLFEASLQLCSGTPMLLRCVQSLELEPVLKEVRCIFSLKFSSSAIMI
jgi:hypothetical protein